MRCTSSSAVALVLGTASMARIFGRPWFYLTLWAWGITTVLRRRGACGPRWPGGSTGRPPHAAERSAATVAVAAAGVAVVASLAHGGRVRRRPPPRGAAQQRRRRAGRPDVRRRGRRASARRPGPTARYVVRWSDAADIGSPGFGLLDELERRGLDVAADEYFHVPVTDHRVAAAGRGRRPDPPGHGRVHRCLAGGARGRRGGHVRPPDARAAGASTPAVRARLIDRLAAEGSADLVPLVDTNLFGMSVDTRLSRGRPGRPDPPDRARPADGRVHRPAARPTTTRTRCDATCGNAVAPSAGAGDGADRHPWEVARARFFRGLIADHVDLAAVATGARRRGRRRLVRPRAPRRTCRPAAQIVCWDINYRSTDLAAPAGERIIRTARAARRARSTSSSLLDVLEHVDDDEAFLADDVVPAAGRGRTAVVSVPAYPRLFSEHDRMLEHHRRYRPARPARAPRPSPRRRGLRSLFTTLLVPRAVTVGHRAGRPPERPDGRRRVERRRRADHGADHRACWTPTPPSAAAGPSAPRARRPPPGCRRGRWSAR